MKKSEYAENNVDAKTIIEKVLTTLKMGVPEFADATGISYQRVYDLKRGRTKKFNPGVVTLIAARFPNIRKEFLYTGEGPVLSSEAVPAGVSPDISQMLAKVLAMQTELLGKMEQLNAREAELYRREIELMRKENELNSREQRFKTISVKGLDSGCTKYKCGNE